MIKTVIRFYSAGMMRSGSTWQYNILASIVEARGLAKRAGFVKTEEELNQIIRANEKCVIKIHNAFKAALDDIGSGSSLGVYIHRDLRDVAASLMVKNRQSLVEILESGSIKTVWENYNLWTRVPGVLVQTYEAMMKHPKKSIEEIGEFCKINLSNNEIDKLSRKYSLEKLKKVVEQVAEASIFTMTARKLRPSVGSFLRKSIGERNKMIVSKPFGNFGKRAIDPHTMIHSDHIAKGKVGAWRNLMSPEEHNLINDYLNKLQDIRPRNIW